MPHDIKLRIGGSITIDFETVIWLDPTMDYSSAVEDALDWANSKINVALSDNDRALAIRLNHEPMVLSYSEEPDFEVLD